MFVFNSCSSSNYHGNETTAISFPDHSFLHFPSPFDHEDASNSLLLQQQQPQHDILLHHIPLNEQPAAPSNFLNSSLGSDSTRINIATTDQYDHCFHQNLIMEQLHQNQQYQIQRKTTISASSKRDRHSKINTLRGPRDRRMRLSLPVAREFFGLQDMLGVDKASKTVEWLLFQARHAIKKLSRDDDDDHHQQSCHRSNDNRDTRSTPSSISDGEEVVSGIDETTTVNNNINTKEGQKATKKDKRSRNRAARKTTFHPLARECRDKARARARERTRKKQLQIRQKMLSSSSDHANYPIEQIDDLSKISSSWSTQMETGEESGGKITTITQIVDEQLIRTRRSSNDQGIIIDEDHNNPDDHHCLMIMAGRWSPSNNNSIYNSLQLHNNNNGCPQENPFGDFQFFGKPWEPYSNNHTIS